MNDSLTEINTHLFANQSLLLLYSIANVRWLGKFFRRSVFRSDVIFGWDSIIGVVEIAHGKLRYSIIKMQFTFSVSNWIGDTRQLLYLFYISIYDWSCIDIWIFCIDLQNMTFLSQELKYLKWNYL